MRQIDKVKQAIEAGHKTIQAVFDFTQDIPKPSIRRVLGQGAKTGHFKRVDKGIYTLITEEGEIRAYVECGNAEDICPRLAATGHKFDMVFLDPAYFSPNLVKTGNRGIDKYDCFYPQQFADMVESIYKMMRNDDSHVYLMLSNAPSIQGDMHRYIFAMMEHGFKPVDEGLYRKMFKNGKAVTNVRGKVAAAERLMLFSRSGQARAGECPHLQLNFTVERPSVKESYSTQKAEPFITQLIKQATFENDITADFGAGSGIFGKCALALNRIVYLIDKLETAVENFILPKIKQFSI